MKTWVRKSLSVGVLTAGALFFGSVAAHADTAQISVDNNGILNGNQAYVPVQVPVNVCGNGIGAVIGVGVGLSGACTNGAAQDVDSNTPDSWTRMVAPKGHPRDVKRVRGMESTRTEDTAQISDDNDGILNGNQIYVPIQVPINICGNGIGVLGIGAGISGGCTNGALQDIDESARTEDTVQVSSDNDGILNGNQVYVPVQVPINICGNGIGILGVGLGLSGMCANGAAQDVDESARTEDTVQVSSDNDGILNGNQVYVPVQVPINICGNGIGALIGVGIGVSGACVNGAAQDVDRGQPTDNGWYGDHGTHSDHSWPGDDHGYKKAKTEGLPLVGGLLQSIPLGTVLGATSGGGMPGLGQVAGKDAPAVGNLPVVGGLKSTKANVAGMDLGSVLSTVG